jgi:hypothetical protein
MPNHLISLDAAKEMTALYRREMNTILAEPFRDQGILAVSETFDRAAFDTLLSEAGCAAVRIYYGMSADLKVHAVVVGVNSNNEDILPSSANSLANDDDGPVILEESQRDPMFDTPPSPLNP